MSIRTSFESERGCGFRKGGGLYLVCDGEGRSCGKLPFEIKPCDQCEALGNKCRMEQCRSWTTVNIDKLFASVECKDENYPALIAGKNPGPDINALEHCSSCPLQGDMGKGGLLWVGEKHYPSPSNFMVEASKMGISKRLPLNQVPKDLTVGKTWVLLAHPKAIDNGPCQRCSPEARPINDQMANKKIRPGYVLDADKPEGWVKCQECKGSGRDFRPGIFKVFKPSALEYIVTDDETDEELEALEKRGFELVRVVKAEDKNGQRELGVEGDPED